MCFDLVIIKASSVSFQHLAFGLNIKLCVYLKFPDDFPHLCALSLFLYGMSGSFDPPSETV